MPADDLTDPAPATTFAHLDATTVLDRDIASQGIYPAVDPLDSTSRILTPEVVGRGALRGRPRGAADSAALQGAAGYHRHHGHGRAVRRGQAARSAAPARCSASCPSRFHVAEQFTGMPGEYVPLKETIRGFQEILEGEHDDLPESAFLFVGHHRRCGRQGEEGVNHDDLSSDGGHAGRLCL